LMTPKSLIGSASDRSWYDNLNRTNTWTKQGRQKNAAQRRRAKQRCTKTTKSRKKKTK